MLTNVYIEGKLLKVSSGLAKDRLEAIIDYCFQGVKIDSLEVELTNGEGTFKVKCQDKHINWVYKIVRQLCSGLVDNGWCLGISQDVVIESLIDTSKRKALTLNVSKDAGILNLNEDEQTVRWNNNRKEYHVQLLLDDYEGGVSTNSLNKIIEGMYVDNYSLEVAPIVLNNKTGVVTFMVHAASLMGVVDATLDLVKDLKDKVNCGGLTINIKEMM